MLRNKFISALDPVTVRQLEIQFVNKTDATLEELERLASILEGNTPATAAALNYGVRGPELGSI